MMDYTKLVEDLRDIEKTMFALGTSQTNMNNVSINLAYDKKWGYTAADAAAAIEALQAETVRLWPKRGKWINSKERMRPDMCSVCGCVYEADRFMDKIAWNYCPNCGAKMGGTE